MNHPVVNRSIVGVFAGVVVGLVLIVLVEYPGCKIHPTGPDFDFNDREQIRSHVEQRPCR